MCQRPYLSECLEHSHTAAKVGQTGLKEETLFKIRTYTQHQYLIMGSLPSCARPPLSCTIVRAYMQAMFVSHIW